jgi:hypothetical protein
MMLTMTDHLMMNVKRDTETKNKSYRLEYLIFVHVGSVARKGRWLINNNIFAEFKGD